MLKRAQEVIASGDERAIVDYAIEANRTAIRASEELKVAKVHLRKLAHGRAGAVLTLSDQGTATSGFIELEGNLGVATVSFSRSEATPRKGKDLKDVEVNLAPEVFAGLFSKEIQVFPVKDFEERAALLGPADRAVVEQFIEIKPSTPKVHLTK